MHYTPQVSRRPRLALRKLAFFKTIFLIGLTSISQAAFSSQTLETFQFNSNSEFESAETCLGCHESQYNQWRSSLMGYSSISPPIHALEVTENHVFRDPDGDGVGFGRLAKTFPNLPNGSAHPSYVSGQENQLFCQKCHAPVAVFTDLFSNIQQFDFGNLSRNNTPDSHSLLRQIAGVDTPTNVTGSISSLEQSNAMTAMEGVTCTVCHRMNGMTTSNNRRPGFQNGIANSGYLIEHFGAQEEPTNFGPIDPSLLVDPIVHNTGITTNSGQLFEGADGIGRPYIQTGEFCGACHDVRIPFPDANIPNSTFRRVENLFTEWQQSAWNNFNLKPSETAGQPAVLDNPRELVLDGNGDPVIGANGEPVKKITTCQDCHMSKFMTDPDAKPGEYEMGLVADNSPEPTRISNHRFIGVDRFLIHDIPGGSTTDELEDFDISQIDSSNTGAFPDLDLAGLDLVDDKADAREILLQKAVDFEIRSAEIVNLHGNDYLPIEIFIENVGAGHNIPAGLSQERQVWIELQVLDQSGYNVFTSGYLSPIEPVAELAENPDPNADPDLVLFDPNGSTRYDQSYCGKESGKHEYECDLDSFRAKLNNDLTIKVENGVRQLFPGDDSNLSNYQNGFTLESDGGRKVFSQFIGDSIDNNNSLAPFTPKIENYLVDLSGHQGPFSVKARLRFRPFPHEFLAALKKDNTSFSTSRVTDEVIKRNKVIEMASDSCIVGNVGGQPLFGSTENARGCSSTKSIAIGVKHSCAVSMISELGTVQCWGQGDEGELGNGIASTTLYPPTEVKGLNNVKMLAAGFDHTCALLHDGTVKCWGQGEGGTLGDGNANNHIQLTPLAIGSQYINNATFITAYNDSTCVVLADKTVKCWGSGISNRLSDGDFSNHNITVPTAINSTWLNNVSTIELGENFGCALLESGEVKCWGNNGSGQIGDGTNINASSPTLVKGLNYRVTDLDVGAQHACVRLKNGEAKCWGNNGLGQLGIGDTSPNQNLPQTVPLFYGADRSISTGGLHSCVAEAGTLNTASCWGYNDTTKAVGGNEPIYYLPRQVRYTSVETVDSGFATTCSTFEFGTRCWGLNDTAQLGLHGFTTVFTDSVNPALTVFNEGAESDYLSQNLINGGSEQWTRLSESTPSGNTGPTSGYNSSSFYYMETSYGHANSAGDTATFTTPMLDAVALADIAAKFSFRYHMNGSDIGSLSVEIYVENLQAWFELESFTGSQGNQWKNYEMYFTNFAPFGRVKLRITATAAGGYLGDIALDNIKLEANH